MAAGSTVPAGHVGSNDAPDGGTAGAVTQIIAGAGVSVSPLTGVGAVTVSATAPAGDVTAVAAGNGISVATPGGPVPTVSADYGAGITDVSASTSSGIATTLARSDHRHAGVRTVQAGTNVSVDATDPANPVVSASGGAGGVVDSVVAGLGINVDATDPANPIVSLTNSDIITQRMTKTGTVLSSVAGPRFTYPADENPTALGSLVAINNIVPLRWVMGDAHLFTGIRVCYLDPDPATQDITITLRKNGVDTLLAVTIPTGSAVGFKTAQLSPAVAFASGDDWGLRIDVPQAGAEGPTAYSVGITVEFFQT